MNQRKKYIYGVAILILVMVLLILIISLVSSGSQEKEEEGDIWLYYVSADGLSFHREPYQFSNKGQTIEMAKEALEQLRKASESGQYQPSIPEEIVWSNLEMEKNNLVIDFTAEYSKMERAKEIFCRASIVKTLVQIDSIQTVEFKVMGTPLMALSDQPVGMMDADDFIDGTEENWGVNQEEKTTLFFASEDGSKLVEKQVEITVVNNIPMEQLIIEALADTEEYRSPLPKGTKVLKTVTKDQICYVDLSKEFLNPMDKVTGKVSVYAIVNSLVERTGVNKVQFTVEGKTIHNHPSKLDFSLPIGRDLDLIE